MAFFKRRILKRQLSATSSDIFRKILKDIDAPVKIEPSQASFAEMAESFELIRETRNVETEYIFVDDAIEYLKVPNSSMVKKAISLFCTQNEKNEIVLDIGGFVSMLWSYCPQLSEQYFYSYSIPFGVPDEIHLADEAEVGAIQNEYERILHALTCWWTKPKKKSKGVGLAERGCAELDDFCSKEFHCYAQNFVQRYNRMFYPAYELQKKMREAWGGDLFWKMVSSGWRRKSVKQSYCRWRLRNIMENYVRYDPVKDTLMTNKPRVNVKDEEKDRRESFLRKQRNEESKRRGSSKNPEMNGESWKVQEKNSIIPKSLNIKKTRWPLSIWNKESSGSKTSPGTVAADSSETDMSSTFERKSPNQREMHTLSLKKGRRSKSTEEGPRQKVPSTSIDRSMSDSSRNGHPLHAEEDTANSKQSDDGGIISFRNLSMSFESMDESECSSGFLGYNSEHSEDSPEYNGKFSASAIDNKHSFVNKGLVISTAIDQLHSFSSCAPTSNQTPSLGSMSPAISPISCRTPSPHHPAFLSEFPVPSNPLHGSHAGGSRASSRTSSRTGSRALSRSGSRSPQFMMDRSPESQRQHRRYLHHSSRQVSNISRHSEMRNPPSRPVLKKNQAAKNATSRDFSSGVLKTTLSPEKIRRKRNHTNSSLDPDNVGDVLQSQSSEFNETETASQVQLTSKRQTSRSISSLEINETMNPSLALRRPISMGRHQPSSSGTKTSPLHEGNKKNNFEETQKETKNNFTTVGPTEDFDIPNSQSVPTRQKIVLQAPL